MERRKFSREFKLEAVKLVRDRGVSAAQASRDLGVHANVLRKWAQHLAADLKDAFTGQGQMKLEQQEITRLPREIIKLKTKCGVPKKAAAYFQQDHA